MIVSVQTSERALRRKQKTADTRGELWSKASEPGSEVPRFRARFRGSGFRVRFCGSAFGSEFPVQFQVPISMTFLPSGVRHAVRRWRHRPGVAVTAVLVLSLGIGATTAMYSIVDAVLLKAEPWPDADRLVRIYGVQPQLRTERAAAMYGGS